MLHLMMMMMMMMVNQPVAGARCGSGSSIHASIILVIIIVLRDAAELHHIAQIKFAIAGALYVRWRRRWRLHVPHLQLRH